MAFYITSETGRTLAQGRCFETLDAAEAAAQRAARASAARTTHGWVPLSVMEKQPGRHVERSVVSPDRIERRG